MVLLNILNTIVRTIDLRKEFRKMDQYYMSIANGINIQGIVKQVAYDDLVAKQQAAKERKFQEKLKEDRINGRSYYLGGLIEIYGIDYFIDTVKVFGVNTSVFLEQINHYQEEGILMDEDNVYKIKGYYPENDLNIPALERLHNEGKISSVNLAKIKLYMK